MNGNQNPWEEPAGEFQNETIVMLQEEISLLETELRLRDEEISGYRTLQTETTLQTDLESAQCQIADLNKNLLERDELIQLLHDQIRQIEEAESQHYQEWEQLRKYVQELETRVEVNGPVQESWKRQLEEGIEAERRKSEEQRQANETERRVWDAQRRAWEEEIQQLRGQLSQMAQETDDNTQAAMNALEEENRLLRTRVQELARESSNAAELHAVRSKFDNVKAQLDKSQGEVQRLVSVRDLDGKSLQLELELESERRKAEALRQSIETERKSWEAQRRTWEEEVQRLRTQLGEIAKQTDAQVNFALAALEEENRALRKRCHELTRDSSAAGELSAVRRDLEAVRAQLEHAQEEVNSLVNTRDQESRGIQVQLELERLKADAYRQAIDSERKNWDNQRKSMEEETHRLRFQLGKLAQKSDAGAREILFVLEEENRVLRSKSQELVRDVAAVAELESTRLELRSVQAQSDQASKEVQTLIESRDKDRRNLLQQVEMQRRANETERRTWDAQKLSWEQEIQQLRHQLEEARQSHDSKYNSQVGVLEEQNRQLQSRLDILEGSRLHAPPPLVREVKNDFRSVRERLDKSQEEIQKRMHKLIQLRGIHRRNGVEVPR